MVEKIAYAAMAVSANICEEVYPYGDVGADAVKIMHNLAHVLIDLRITFNAFGILFTLVSNRFDPFSFLAQAAIWADDKFTTWTDLKLVFP
jgi:hypothetical protein